MTRIFAIFAFCLAAVHPSHALADTYVSGWENFLNSANYGQMGIWVSGGERTPRIVILPQNSTISIRAPSGQIAVVLNQLDRLATSADMSPTYVGVLVVLAHKTSTQRSSAPFYIFRNAGWFRDWCMACIDRDGVKRAFQDANILSKVAAARSGVAEENLDAIFEHKDFDGQLVDASEVDSWDDRAFWNRPLDKEPECQGENVECNVENVLLRFTPSAGHPNMRPIIYGGLNVEHGSTVDFYLFSPGEIDFSGHYKIAIQ
jgi:hypothetical protein